MKCHWLPSRVKQSVALLHNSKYSNKFYLDIRMLVEKIRNKIIKIQ